MLVTAYSRLFWLPRQVDGSKRTIIASYGAYDVRLTEVATGPASPIMPLWIELYDSLSNQVIDSAGCRDLQEAGAAVEDFFDEALRLAGTS